MAALYLAEKSSDAQSIIAQNKPSRVVMHTVYREMERVRILAGREDGFAANQHAKQLAGLRERRDPFHALIGDLKQGDHIHFDKVHWPPDEGGPSGGAGSAEGHHAGRRSQERPDAGLAG